MKGECFSYHISTNYSHFNDPTPQMQIRTKKYVFLLFFFYWHVLNDQFHHKKLTQIESINPVLSFDTKIVWLG